MLCAKVQQRAAKRAAAHGVLLGILANLLLVQPGYFAAQQSNTLEA